MGKPGMLDLYAEAAKLLGEHDKTRIPVRSLVLSRQSQHKQPVKQLHALLCSVVKYREVISSIQKKLDLQENAVNTVLLHEMIFGHKNGLRNLFYATRKTKDQRIGKVRQSLHQMLKHQSAAGKAVRALCEAADVKNPRDLVQNADDADMEEEASKRVHEYRRWVRVNTIKLNLDEAISHFTTKDSYKFEGDFDSARVSELEEQYKDSDAARDTVHFFRDTLITNLLSFPRFVEFHDHPLYKSGSIVLQDKASCFPAQALMEPYPSPRPSSPSCSSPSAGGSGMVVAPWKCCLDACAAPGNKTSHLSALMSSQGEIYACDKSRRRLDLLKSLTGQYGCTNIRPMNVDFLTLEGSQSVPVERVEAILLDPSCSGSGMIWRDSSTLQSSSNMHPTTAEDQKRVAQLADFQTRALTFALTQFPHVKRVGYSTCSVWEDENEDVVASVLKDPYIAANFRLVHALPGWEHRGLANPKNLSPTLSPHCVRTDPQRNRCIGFFLACFERVTDDSEATLSTSEESALPKEKHIQTVEVTAQAGDGSGLNASTGQACVSSREEERQKGTTKAEGLHSKRAKFSGTSLPGVEKSGGKKKKRKNNQKKKQQLVQRQFSTS